MFSVTRNEEKVYKCTHWLPQVLFRISCLFKGIREGGDNCSGSGGSGGGSGGDCSCCDPCWNYEQGWFFSSSILRSKEEDKGGGEEDGTPSHRQKKSQKATIVPISTSCVFFFFFFFFFPYPCLELIIFSFFPLFLSFFSSSIYTPFSPLRYTTHYYLFFSLILFSLGQLVYYASVMFI